LVFRTVRQSPRGPREEGAPALGVEFAVTVH
jgi:hypothetical protein